MSGEFQVREGNGYRCSRHVIQLAIAPFKLGHLRKDATMLQIPNCAEIDVAPEFLCLSFNACGARAQQLHETMAALALEDNQ